MDISIISIRSIKLILVTLLFTLSIPAFASVKYKFIVTEQPTGDFFKPLVAEIVLSDDAVVAGEARNGQIESLLVSGGPAMQEVNRITLAYLHSAFYDLTVTLSSDKSTIASISAKLSPNGDTIDHWVFHYQHPEHPDLQIHEFLAYIRADRVGLETTILPVPPTTHLDNFQGQWQRVSVSNCCFFRFPFCWLDWVIIGVVVTLLSVIIWQWRSRKDL